jgi:hypothetical protein
LHQKSSEWKRLRALTTEAAGELDVLALDGDTLGVDGAEVGVLEERDEVSLNGLLKSADGRGLEAEVRLEVLSDLTNKTLERQLADEELGRLLVATDLTESDGTGLVAVRLLDTSG